MALNFNRRGVLRETRFTQSLNKILADYPRAIEVISGVEWSLARDPETDGIRFGGNVWVARLAKSPPMPAARIFYCFTKRLLHMLEIELVDDE
jgi:hypothetical protein